MQVRDPATPFACYPIRSSSHGLLNFPFHLLRFLEPLDNFIFYCIIASCAYAVVQNLRGREPNDIPVISEAAWMQIGPF